MTNPVHAPDVVGFAWTSIGTWVPTAAVLACIGVLSLILRLIGPWRRQTTEAEHRLREGLEVRVVELERRLELQNALMDAERSLYRHETGNLAQCFDAVLLSLELAPDKVPEIVEKVRAMRERQMVSEAEEKAAIHAVRIAALGIEVANAQEAVHEHT